MCYSRRSEKTWRYNLISLFTPNYLLCIRIELWFGSWLIQPHSHRAHRKEDIYRHRNSSRQARATVLRVKVDSVNHLAVLAKGEAAHRHSMVRRVKAKADSDRVHRNNTDHHNRAHRNNTDHLNKARRSNTAHQDKAAVDLDRAHHSNMAHQDKVQCGFKYNRNHWERIKQKSETSPM